MTVEEPFMKPSEKHAAVTLFRESRDISNSTAINADTVLVYGLDSSVPARIEKWKNAGYNTGLIADFSRGDFTDWLSGKVDGVSHSGDVQTDRQGKQILYAPGIPYIIPTIAFTEYYIKKILPFLESSIDCVCIESPGFSALAGYGEVFRAEWEIYYRQPWQPPHSSADAQYKASVLKAYLVTRAVDRIATMLKYEAKTVFGKDLKVYISVASAVDMALEKMICPVSDIASLNSVDGFIGKAADDDIDDSSRENRLKTFEASFLRYGLLQELVAGTGKKMFLSVSPVSDDPTQGWAEHRINYEKNLTAALMQPNVTGYEICPMPHRAMLGKYPRKPGSTPKPIPGYYKTELLNLFSVLGDICGKESKAISGENPIGVLFSDNAMFQRIYPDGDSYEKAYNRGIDLFHSFYGLCMPLLERGIAVRPVQAENIAAHGSCLDKYRILILSYQFMKPESSRIHFALMEWIMRGGVLIVAGDRADTFNGISAWWNQNGNSFSCPDEHLMKILGLSRKADGIFARNKKASQVLRSLPEGIFPVKKGVVAVFGENPQYCINEKAYADFFCKTVISAASKAKIPVSASSTFALGRGPYKILSMPKETGKTSVPINGLFVDLLSPELDVESFIVAESGARLFLYDLEEKKDCKPEIIAISANILDYTEDENGISFSAAAPEGVDCVCRLYCPSPVRITEQDMEIPCQRDESGKTVLFRFTPGSLRRITINTAKTEGNGTNAKGR